MGVIPEEHNKSLCMKGLLDRLLSLDIIQVLANKPFFNFTLTVIFSQMAVNMMNIVLIFLIFHLTSSNFSVSMLVMTILVPQVVLGFIGGIYADLTNRRTILFVGNILRAIIILILFFDTSSKMLVYIVALGISIITQFYTPAESPLIPNLVRGRQLISANSIFGISLFGSILVGYVLAGPSIQHIGRSQVFILISVLFVAAAIFALLIPKKAAQPETESNGKVTQEIKKSLREEMQYIFSLLRYTSEAGGAFFLLIFSQVAIWVLSTIVPGYARQVLSVPAEDLSILLFAPAALGMIISSVIIGVRFVDSDKNKVINLGIIISAFALIVFPAISMVANSAVVRDVNIFLPDIFDISIVSIMLIVAFLAGFANALISVPCQTIIQTVVPESSRSKIFGLLFALIGAFSLIPIILAGGIADIFGVGTVLVIMGLLIFVAGVIRIKPFLFKKI